MITTVVDDDEDEDDDDDEDEFSSENRLEDDPEELPKVIGLDNSVIHLEASYIGCLAHITNLPMSDYSQNNLPTNFLKMAARIRKSPERRRKLRAEIKLENKWFQNGKILPQHSTTRWWTFATISSRMILLINETGLDFMTALTGIPMRKREFETLKNDNKYVQKIRECQLFLQQQNLIAANCLPTVWKFMKAIDNLNNITASEKSRKWLGSLVDEDVSPRIDIMQGCFVRDGELKTELKITKFF